jgi:uncharacterized membrane protein
MRELHQLREAEKHLLARLQEQGHTARDVVAEDVATRTFGERLADDLAHFVGSWPFIVLFLLACGVWAFLNGTELLLKAWDPYPFILLNLFLSLLAGLQAPVIMMSQNRQEERDRLRSQADYEVNLKAELEIEALHGKMDDLREQRWAELIALQQQQIQLLHQQITLLQTLCRDQGVDRAIAPD